MRVEKDFIGEIELPANARYGINAFRARENFPDQTLFHKEWYCAMANVKQACYETYVRFKASVLKQYANTTLPFELLEDSTLKAMLSAAVEMSSGNHFEHFIVPAIQGGAGTSINMNVNEIIANVALEKLGHSYGNYTVVDPLEHANIYQSTNDVVPTALKVAIIQLLKQLEESINKNRTEVERFESQCRNTLRQGYTQMQAAVPSSYDKLFSAYNNALSRDWWRVSKCFERIKEVNLGGGALGTGLAVPRFFIMEVVSTLQRLTGLPITRSENLCDATSNLDSYVEVHATLKAHAVNLEKMVNDLRLLASDIFINRELFIPQKQLGSSIMPGKVNPVIPEFVISSVHRVYANDLLISNLSGQGCLDLNAYLPSIGHALIDSIKLLIGANNSIQQHLMKGLVLRPSNTSIYYNASIVTALIPHIGYHHAALLSKEMHNNGLSIQEANSALKLIDTKTLDKLLQPDQLLKLGFRIGDLFSET